MGWLFVYTATLMDISIERLYFDKIDIINVLLLLFIIAHL